MAGPLVGSEIHGFHTLQGMRSYIYIYVCVCIYFSNEVFERVNFGAFVFLGIAIALIIEEKSDCLC